MIRLLPSMAIISLSLVLYDQHRSLDRYSTAISALAQIADETALENGLTGSVFPTSALRELTDVRSGGATFWDSSRPLAVWIVDVQNCVGCFGASHEWTRLDLPAVVVAVGGSREALTDVDSFLPTNVRLVDDRAGSISGILGLHQQKSARLLVSGAGRILLADLRDPGSICQFSFIAHVQGILALSG